MKQDERDKKIFIKLFKEFYEKCMKFDIIPIPNLNYTSRGIYPYIDFQHITKRDKKNINKAI